MSGILIPGQENRPRPSGGIELPKGFSRTHEQVEEQAEAASTPETQTESPVDAAVDAADVYTESGILLAPSGELDGESTGTSTPIESTDIEGAEADDVGAGAAGDQPLQPELLFPPMGAQIQCPSCSSPYTVPVFSIVDLGVNPELKMPLLSGQINVALCNKCGAGGPMGAPLMVHDPENDFLGVYIPAESGMNDIQRQKSIGDMTQALMGKLPQDARRGYMLQPVQFMDWQRLMEKLWESEGVTPEMLRRQSAQSAALQQLLSLASDEQALEIVINRNSELIDRHFIGMLQQYISAAEQQGRAGEHEIMMKLYQKILAVTEAGAEVQKLQDKVRNLLSRIDQQSTREQVLDVMIDAWRDEDSENIVPALVSAISPMLDYQFLLALSDRVDQAETDADKELLNELRHFVTTFQEQQQQQQEAMVQQVQMIVQDVLRSQDPKSKLREYADYINDTFINILASNIQHAQQENAEGMARSLTQVYQLAMEVVQERMTPEMRLLNQLVTAQDESAVRQLLREHRHLLTKEFMEMINPLEENMRQSGQADLADRLKSVRGRIALML